MRYLVLVALLLLAAPLVASLGPSEILRTWEAPAGALGTGRQLTLSIRESWAYVDIFRLHRSHRLIITDGGYVFGRDFPLATTDPELVVSQCEVTWDAEKVELLMPDGVKMVFPAKAVMGEIGT